MFVGQNLIWVGQNSMLCLVQNHPTLHCGSFPLVKNLVLIDFDGSKAHQPMNVHPKVAKGPSTCCWVSPKVPLVAPCSWQPCRELAKHPVWSWKRNSPMWPGWNKPGNFSSKNCERNGEKWEFQLETPVFHQRNGDFTIADPEILANHENMERWSVSPWDCGTSTGCRIRWLAHGVKFTVKLWICLTPHNTLQKSNRNNVDETLWNIIEEGNHIHHIGGQCSTI